MGVNDPKIPDDPRFEEWCITRELLSEYDGYIHDIRKYGFSFITALITAQAILIPSNNLTNILNPSGIPDHVKFGVFAVTLFLILAIAFFEKSYKLIQESTAKRALILELTMNLELSQTLISQFESREVRISETVVYILFIVGIIGLAFVTLSNTTYVYFLLIFSIIIMSVIIILKPSKSQRRDDVDWTVNRMVCNEGDIVEINIVNTGKKKEIIKKGGVILEIKNQDPEDHYCHQEIAKDDLYLLNFYCHTCLWDTKGVKRGIYQIFPYGDNGKKDELNYLQKLIKVY